MSLQLPDSARPNSPVFYSAKTTAVERGNIAAGVVHASCFVGSYGNTFTQPSANAFQSTRSFRLSPAGVIEEVPIGAVPGVGNLVLIAAVRHPPESPLQDS